MMDTTPTIGAEPKGAWMQTYTLSRFSPLDPDPNTILIEDIAHHLSQAVRYGGAGIRFLSVAEHSVLLARAAKPEHALWALLHDASEAYLHDIVRPVKRELEGYVAAEDRLMRAVCERFGLPPDMPREVKALDNRILIDETRQNMRPSDVVWTFGGETEPLGINLQYWTPERAEREFLASFTAITGLPVKMPPALTLGDLDKLSADARQGEWTVESLKNYGSSESESFTSYRIECGGQSVLDALNSDGGYLEQEPGDDEIGPFVWDEQARRDLTFVAALVEGFRNGSLVPAAPGAGNAKRPAGIAQALRQADWGSVSIGNKALIAAAISELEAAPAPATPPGVPDSLRALNEAAPAGRFEVFRGIHHYVVVAEATGQEGLLNLADANFAAASANFVRTLRAAHPAGQSEPPILRVVVEVHPDRTDTRLTFGERIRPEAGVKAVEQAIAALAAEYEARGGCPVVGRLPAGQGAGQGAGQEAKTKIPADREAVIALAIHLARDGDTSLIEKIKAELSAPDSTRTGDEGTDGIEAIAEVLWRSDHPAEDDVSWANWLAYVADHHYPVSLTRDIEHCRRRARAIVTAFPALAARPAAPEAQGAWSFDMEAAPRDGTPLDLWAFNRRFINYRWDREGRVGGWWSDARHKDRDWRDRECLMPAPVSAWRIADAPPTPSGQGGR